MDFEKAYDKVSRQKLLTFLAEQGCGAQFLSAIANILKDTDNIIGFNSFKATAGVYQGGATSCSLCTFYVNAIIRKVKEFGPDGFLYMVHLLMLMDDTVIFATSRRGLEQKVALLMETTVALHMLCHPVKSKFMTVNTSDTEPFIINGITCTILYTDSYLYLGSPTSNAHMQKQVADHMSEEVSCQEVLFIPPKELKSAIHIDLCVIEYSFGDARTALKHGDEACLYIWHLT